jgi:hypothetical protein
MKIDNTELKKRIEEARERKKNIDDLKLAVW